MLPLHLLISLLVPLPLLTTAHTSTLYASSYSGNVTVLSLIDHSTNHQQYPLTNSTPHNYTLTAKYSAPCAGDPSWLTLDSDRGLLYCIGEGLAGIKGGLTIFSTLIDGELHTLSSTDIGPSAVNAVLHGPHPATGRRLVLANYSSAVSTYNLTHEHLTSSNSSTTTTFPAPTLLQTLPFTLASPGPVAGRQTAPHPHQVVLDPSHQYILSPDLGADVVHVFRIQNGTGTLAEAESLPVKKGTGARHLVFWRSPGNGGNCTGEGEGEGEGGSGGKEADGIKPIGRSQRVMKRDEHHGAPRRRRYGYGVAKRAEGQAEAEGQHGGLFMYLVGELGNTVTSYSVSYPPAGGMSFTEIGSVDTFGGKGVPAGAAAAEIAVSGNHLIISNRADTSFPNPPSGPSDSLATFTIAPTNGSLTFLSLAPAGGIFPRHFSLNRRGDLVAVGLQKSGKVVVIGRDVRTGEMGGVVAEWGGLGNVTCVVWDEEG